MKVFTILSLLIIGQSFAQYKGEVFFSEAEILHHYDTINKLVDTSRNCLLRYKKVHEEFYKNNCVKENFWSKKKCLSKFYGERRYSKKRFARRSDGKFLEYLPKAVRKAGFDEDLVDEMEATSCVGLALQCLKEGFQATNQEDQWARIMTFVRANNVGGTALQDALQKIGWKVYYWNPVSHDSIIEAASKWDEEEAKWQSKGWHAYRYSNVMGRGTYWFNKVDNTNALVGFGENSPSYLKKFPYWVATANTGYHVFPGTFGKVVEAHSTRDITAFDNLEFSEFNPFGEGGGPRWTRSEKYRSGLFALPPVH